MSYFKKITAVLATAALAATSFVSCTPSIGSGTTKALTVDGKEIPAGIFVYYTMQGYNEAASVLQTQNGTSPAIKDVRNANIDSIDSTEWIQNKATEYCIDYANTVMEFESIGGELSHESKDQASEMAEYYFASDSRLTENGVSVESLKKIAEANYMKDEIFKYYYGFDGSKGCSEDELKEYFKDNFARVKYVSISLTDDAGEKVAPDKERELRNMAEKYADQVNKKYSEKDKMAELDVVRNSYDEYVAAQTTTAEGETTTTTTTTTAAPDETTTTTTTSPYYYERLIQKETTTAAADDSTDSETTAAEESDYAKNTRLFNEYVFNELPMGKAQVYDYSDEEIYVVIRAELDERMTEDDFWSEDYISSLQSMKYYDEFTEFLNDKASSLTVDKNKSAYRRYSPFKLTLE